MSERMNEEQTIEQIKNIKEYIINPHQAEPQSMVFKQTQREKRLQALDIAIDCIEELPKIKHERDLYLEQLRNLGEMIRPMNAEDFNKALISVELKSECEKANKLLKADKE